MRPRDRRRAFTLVELLVVIVIIAILASLLLPAITGAMRTAKNSAVTADINTLSQALAAFKEKYGDYPPSRIMLAEHGTYLINDPAAKTMIVSGNGTGGADITYAELAQRSMTYLKKFFPRVALSPDGYDPAIIKAGGGKVWYDFNGNGIDDYDTNAGDGYFGVILEGDECLTFFLGGIPLNTGSDANPVWSMSGFGKDPLNPFTNNLDNGNRMYSGNRLPTLFEFKNERLRDMDDPAGDIIVRGGTRFPSYHDSLGTDAPIAYFSAYGGERYDPNDCNFAPLNSLGQPAGAEADTGPGPLLRGFRVTFPIAGSTKNLAVSAAPNPYHISPSPVSATNPAFTTQWHKGASFQLISPGADGLYGIGGIYRPNDSQKLPADAGTLSGTTDTAIRSRENDNLTNFAGGRLD